MRWVWRYITGIIVVVVAVVVICYGGLRQALAWCLWRRVVACSCQLHTTVTSRVQYACLLDLHLLFTGGRFPESQRISDIVTSLLRFWEKEGCVAINIPSSNLKRPLLLLAGSFFSESRDPANAPSLPPSLSLSLSLSLSVCLCLSVCLSEPGDSYRTRFKSLFLSIVMCATSVGLLLMFLSLSLSRRGFIVGGRIKCGWGPERQFAKEVRPPGFRRPKSSWENNH